MIFIAFALFAEAKPFIKKYSLIKDTSFTKAQVFKNGSLTAIITGTGIGISEIALTYALTLLNPKSSDIFANYGICGGAKADIEKTFIINSIYDTVNKKSYYPDIIYKNAFVEKGISTYPAPVKEPEGLCDMEAAFLYKSAQLFFPQHRIFIFKTVSDSGNAISKQYIESIIETDKIYDFLSSLPNESTDILTQADIYAIDEFCTDSRFTQSMKSELKQILKYKKLTESLDIADFFGQSGIKTVNDKKGGKKLLEQLSKNL